MKILRGAWLCFLVFLTPSAAQTDRARTYSSWRRGGNDEAIEVEQISTLIINSVTDLMQKRSPAATADPGLDIDLVKDIGATGGPDVDLAMDFTIGDVASAVHTTPSLQRRWGRGWRGGASAERPAASDAGYTGGGGYWGYHSSAFGSGVTAGVNSAQGIPATVISTGYQSAPSGATEGARTKENSPPSITPSASLPPASPPLASSPPASSPRSNPPLQSISTYNSAGNKDDGGITVTVTSTLAPTQTKTMTISSVSGSRQASKRWTDPK
ncbi:hypothetical protein PV10_06707 [Exophiala mesophila]|uniref:Uncharacterized protein n=1 Tax=Exophiala mesophila TaxID=212818 RepID=A0A0D1WST8_EXOME|nr:uncharacterized protein PV10_06707 [Exophiala mesophila]KIV92250.1 hypothetical protein PV10_06707 [Exophiala mesophila]